MSGPPVDLLLGLDVGTTSTKAVVFDLAGSALAVGRAPTRWSAAREMPAGAVLDAARSAISGALAAAPAGRVAGVGVTSMAESGVLIDGHGEPVAPVIAWHDTRDLAEVTRLGRDLGASHFSARTGLPLRSQWALTKHRWALDHDPAAARAVRRLNIAEWVVRGLGGDEASDVSLASRTGWLDLAARGWWTEALDWSGAPESLLPPLVTSGAALGVVGTQAGLPGLAGAVLTTAGHDHQAAALGADAAGPGDQLDSCGTAEALVRTVPAGLAAEDVSLLARSGITVGWHVLEGRWALLGATEGGLALQRLLSVLGGSEALVALDTAASVATTGEVVVTLDGSTRVTVSGVGDGVSPGQVWRAALETTTADIRRVHDAMTAVAGPHRRMVVTGGWARSAGVMALKRAAFGELVRSGIEEAGSRGAALLAGLAAGAYASPAEFPPLPRGAEES